MLDFVKNQMPRGIEIGQLCKHMFICGMPGYGKTTGVFAILLQLFAHRIPFLVIETAKREYRGLKALATHAHETVRGLADKVEVYTPGCEWVSPYRFNPLCRPRGVERDVHIDQVLRCFKGAMPMWEPLPALLGESLEVVLPEGSEGGTPPTLEDLYAASKRVVDGTRYPADMKGQLLAALEVRLGMLTRRSLGTMMRSTACIPDIAHLVKSYSIIELDDLEGDIKCLLTLFLLTAIHQQVRMHGSRPTAAHAGLQLVIVIEEIHNVVGRSADVPTAENQANPKAHATELICRMLAEFRALGVGLILIDQSPGEVAPQVVKNTGTKLAIRQVARDDREILADAMLFSDLEYEEIARLLPGEAYLFAEGYHRSHRIKTPNMAEWLSLRNPPEDDWLAARLREDAWYKEAQVRRTAETLLRFRVAMDRYEHRKVDAQHKLEDLLRQRLMLVQGRNSSSSREARTHVAAAIERIGQQVARSYDLLERGLYQEILQLDTPKEPSMVQLGSTKQNQVRRFETVLRPQAERLHSFVKRTVAQLRTGVLTVSE